MSKYLIGSYSILSLLFVLFSFAYIGEKFPYLQSLYTGFYSTYRLETMVLYIILLLLLFIVYFATISFFQKKRIHVVDLKKIIVGISIVLAFAYPAMLSTDIFNYVSSARIIAHFHLSPYEFAPEHFVGDPWQDFINYRGITTVYGPSWTLLSTVPYFLGFENYLLVLFNTKILIIIFYLATIFLLWKMSRNAYAVLLFALNPLTIIETLVSAHNDIVMMFFALLALYLVRKKQFILACIMLVISIAIKYVTVALLPVLLYCIWQEARGRQVNWEKIYFVSAMLMLVMFFVSYFHKEIYPWYVIWFMVFSYLIPQRKSFLMFTTALSFGMLLTDLPFMLVGSNTSVVQWSKFLLASGGTMIFFILSSLRWFIEL
jgi:hypothetical protein